MFLRMSSFKTLIKNAWQGAGLTVGNDGEGIYLMGSYWTIWLERSGMTKKAKAAIVELAGELPGAGEVFKCWKDRDNQYELEETKNEDYYNPNVYGFETRYKDTGIVFSGFGRSGRILQNVRNLKCVLIPEFIHDMIDSHSMEKDECYPEGPKGRFTQLMNTDMIFWQNEFCTMGCMTTTIVPDSKESFVMKELQKYNFNENRVEEE